MVFEAPIDLLPKGVLLDRKQLLALAKFGDDQGPVARRCELREPCRHSEERLESLQEQELLLHRRSFLLTLERRLERRARRGLRVSSRDGDYLGAA